MQMITELEVKPHETMPARKLEVNEFKVNNFRYHSCLQMLSRNLLALCESQSNNMKGELVPRDVSSTRMGFEAFKVAWKFALDHNDPPSAAHEFGYKIVFPTPKELQRIPNVKTKMVALEYMHLAEIIMASDSANASANVAPQSQADVDTQIKICEDALDLWYGKGKDNKDVGQTVPVFKHLGTLIPDTDLDYAEVREPSADQPTSGRPDAADVLIGD